MALPEKSTTDAAKQPDEQVASDFFEPEEDKEERNILKLTQRSAWVLLAISLLLTIDHILPVSVVEEEAVEFIHAGNVLEKVLTESSSFRPSVSHDHSSAFSQGPVLIYKRPITGFVSSYQLAQDEHKRQFKPEFCQDSWISLVYITLGLSLAQLLIRMPLFYRMAAWIFSVGSIFGYTLMVFAFS